MPRSAMRRPRPVVGALCCAALAVAVVACGDEDAAQRPVVTVFGTLSDADGFIASVAGFERSTGIDVRFVGSSNFETDLLARLRRGDPPDLALLPQPGLLDRLVEDGFALEWTGDLGTAATAGVDPRLASLATYDDAVYGSWYEVVLKSLVWYSPREFRARGFEVPTTWDELEQLAAQIADSGTRPWCLGVRDGGATGWVATDWVEDLVLRFAGTDAYDGWVAHDVLFADAPIADAVERFMGIALDDRLVHGGNRAAIEFTVNDAARQVAEPSPPCLLHRQASFLPRLLGRTPQIAPDGELWAFPLPSVDGGAAPMLAGGSVIARFSDAPASDRVAAFLSSPDAAQVRAASGGFVSARESFDPAGYRSAFDRTVAGWLRDAEVLRFDASDRMPPEVGVGEFWTGMTSVLGGARTQAVLADIDAAWPLEPEPREPGAGDG